MVAFALLAGACASDDGDLLQSVPASADTSAVDADYCPTDPTDPSCAAWLDGLDDDEFCRFVPDDDFCGERTNDADPEDSAVEQDDVADDAEPSPSDTDSDDAAASVDEDRNQSGGATAGIDPSLTRDDGQCLPDDDADSDQQGTEINLVYQVVGGQLGATCFGSPDETVEWAWRVLADLVPPAQLNDLSVFAGFSSTEGEDNTTLAYVQNVDDDGDQFLMAVNIEATKNDPDEATLTMAHEFTHVFTALPTELDRSVDPGDCEGFDNGEGCYLDDSILNQWFQTFWQNVPGDPTSDEQAQERCDLDPGFFGSYGASNPEEDFAEAFSAYVLRVEPRGQAQQNRLDFIDRYPGLREFRDRAVDRDYGPLDHNFEACG